MSYRPKLKAGFISLCLVLFCSSAFGGDVTTVYFVPFEIETYAPITQAEIIPLAWEKWTISSEAETSRLITSLSQGDEEKFDENKVRALVLSDEQKYFIDSNGVVLKRGKLGNRIDKAAFIQFRDSLRADQRQMLGK